VQSLADAYAGRRVLITGGLGFIGSNLAIALAQGGAEVTVLDALLPAYGGQRCNVEPILDRVSIDLSDLRDDVAVRRAVAGQDSIFSLAGQMSHLNSMRDPLTDLEMNCRAHLFLLEACRTENPAVKLVLASTRQVYGRPQRLPVDETPPPPPRPNNPQPNTYGPRMDLRSREKGVVGVLLRHALTGNPLQLFGTGQQRRDFNYVTDVVDALLLAGSRSDLDGGCFNLGHPQPHSLLELVHVLQRLIGCRYECVPFPADQRAIDIGDYFGDFGRFQALTGWFPQVDLEDGMAETIRFVRQHADRYL
jgi:UDP-glucose 4-epimerase